MEEPWIDSARKLLERGLLPDVVTRAVARRLLREQLDRGTRTSEERPVGLIEPESFPGRRMPPAFYRRILGPAGKLSCVFFDGPDDTLEAAETRTLRQTVARAGIEDGHRVLDLGCGLGALSLFIARTFEHCQVVAVTASPAQARFVETRRKALRLDNVEVVHSSLGDYESAEPFDRVISIEALDQSLGSEALVRHAASLLLPEGELFVQSSCHVSRSHTLQPSTSNLEWLYVGLLGGSKLPAADQRSNLEGSFTLEEELTFSGDDYARTVDGWLEQMDAARSELKPLFTLVYGDESARWWNRWRAVLMGVSELFRQENGEEWVIKQYRLRPRAEAHRQPAPRISISA